MKKDELSFELMPSGNYHTVFRNNHSRKIYLQIERQNDELRLIECCYIDRPLKSGRYPIPKKFKPKQCKCDELIDIIATTLDKRFYGMSFSCEKDPTTRDEYIQSKQGHTKYQFLIFVKDGTVIRTRLKSRVHREIYLEIQIVFGQAAHISDCHYCDRQYRTNGKIVTPVGLTTVFFYPTKENLLRIVNEELNCDFTDIIITEDTFGFYEKPIPICGAI